VRKRTIAGGLAVLPVLLGLGGWLYLRAPDLPAATLIARYAQPESRFAELAGGVRLHYLDGGRRDGPPVLLIHGFGDNAFTWDAWTKRLGREHRVLVVDLPGHGLTAAPADYAASAERYADLIDAFLGKIGVASAAVAGNSMGGGVSWQLAVRHPARVTKLVLIDAAGVPSPPSNEPPPLAFRIMRYEAGRRLLASIDNTPLIRSGLAANLIDRSALTEPFIRRWADLQRFPDHRRILMSVAIGGSGDPDAMLRRIRVPTLILWGAQDRLIPLDAAHRFERTIAGATLIVYPDVGHMPQLEIADRSAADAEAFLAEQ